MPKKTESRIYVGVGGWTFAPWRGTFYPEGLAQKRELEHASRQLTSIEINGTFYGSQKPASFAKWHDETPQDFIFALKGPRFTTNRRALSEAGESIERFFNSGVMMLKDKLGPVNWQLPPTKKFDAEDIAAFFALLPRSIEGRGIRHAIEARHESFRHPEFVAVAREHGVAIVLAGDSSYPQIADITAPFVYTRIMGTQEGEDAGYAPDGIDRWARRARDWASGKPADGLETLAAPPKANSGRDVFLYVISGFKQRNPQAAMAIIAKLG